MSCAPTRSPRPCKRPRLALGRIDILVNNAGITLGKKTVEVVTGRTVYLDGGQTIAW
jgi:NAD(P)-dependent dehydrogenase (short-subunit alcohol dehydrogenase family)